MLPLTQKLGAKLTFVILIDSKSLIIGKAAKFISTMCGGTS